MADWLSRHNHSKKKDKEIAGRQISINVIQSTTNSLECMTICELQEATSQDQHLQHLMEYVIQGWPESKSQLPEDIRAYWLFRDNMAVIDGVVIKGRCIVIPDALQQQALKQLHINHMGIEKTKFLVHKSVYWIDVNADIENHIKIVLHALIFSKLNQKKRLFIMTFQTNHGK